MQQLVQSNRSGALTLEQVPVPALQPGGVLVQAKYSLVSVGTEAMKVKTARMSLVGKARSRPDLVRQVIQTYRREGIANTYRKVMTRLDTPAPLGYSLSGVVVDVAPDVEDFAVGDLVACAGAGYANHADVAFVPRHLVANVPVGVGLDLAAFTTLGAIAIQGVRQAEVQMGARVGVIGLGLLGQLTCQLLTAAGSKVFGIDLDPMRVALARELGAAASLPRNSESLHQSVMAFSNGHGLDTVVITAATRSSDPIDLAAELVRDRGRIVVVGIVGMEAKHKLFYDKELDLRMSRSYGPGRYDPKYEEDGIDYPLPYVRWTEQRNMVTFLEMIASGRLRLDRLITHRFPFAEARAAYDLIVGPHGNSVLGLILEYGETPAKRGLPVILRDAPLRSPGEVRLGVIGAGNFARTMLLPRLTKLPSVVLDSVATASPVKAQDTARRFGFLRVFGDGRDILRDASVNAILIATRHDQHAPLVVEALRAGKAVFVEKPLALNEVELTNVVQAYEESPKPFLMVGYNRRFAPLVDKMKKELPTTGPYFVQYRVNAGFLARDHWYNDPVRGGGRLIGEACHFVDLMGYLTGAKPVMVTAMKMSDAGTYCSDNFTLSVEFQDGSLGNLTYVANGDKSLPKERIEVSAGGVSAILDDFRSLVVARGGKAEKTRASAQDKGHAAEMSAFANALKRGEDSPIPIDQLVLTSLTTLCAARAIRERRPIAVDSALLGTGFPA